MTWKALIKTDPGDPSGIEVIPERTVSEIVSPAADINNLSAAIEALIEDLNIIVGGTTQPTKTLAALISAKPFSYQGVISGSGNPNYPAGSTGDVYIVSVAGKVGGASGVTVEIGDMLLCNTDNSAAGTQAAVGANWNIIQANIDPSSFVAANNAITGATKTKITYDAKGLVTSGADATASDVGAVPTTRQVNSKALSADITLAASDVGAVPTTRQVNSKALSADITLAAADVGAVPTTRQVNSKALSADITLSASDVSAVAANGAITAATKTKITYDVKGLVTAGADATTADIADSTDKRYCTDAQKTVIGNTSGTNSGNETTTSVGTLVSGATTKDAIVDADVVGYSDSADSNKIKKTAWSNIKSVLKTYFASLFLGAAPYAASDAAPVAIDWNNGNTQSVTIASSRTFTFANPVSGQVYRLVITQGSGGSKVATWPTVKWSGGSTLSTAAGAIDIVTLLYVGTTYYGSLTLNFA